MRHLLALCILATFADAASAEVPLEVQELVFGALLPEESVGFIYCMSVDGEDIAPGVLARLQRADLTIVAASECTQNRNPRTGSVHNASGKKAMFYRLSDFSVGEETGATVKFESYHHGARAEGGTVMLESTDGAWRVTGVFRTWVA